MKKIPSNLTRILVLILAAFLLSGRYTDCFATPLTDELKQYTLDGIYVRDKQSPNPQAVSMYHFLLKVRKGDRFNYKNIRESMENLYKIGSFDDIDVNIKKKENSKLDIVFVLAPRLTIESIRIKIVEPDISRNYISLPLPFKKIELKNAISSVRESTYFDKNKLGEMEEEVKKFLGARGYFNSSVTHQAIKNPDHSTVKIKLTVSPGKRPIIEKIDVFLKLQDQELYLKIKSLMDARYYVPTHFNKKIDKVYQLLKKRKYYFPDISLKEDFLDPLKEKVNLSLTVNPGYRHEIQFVGMGNKISLVSSVWEKRVFEKWAETESKARILYYLKNRGYLSAEVGSKVEVNEKDSTKVITFDVKKNKKYKLGKIYLKGNFSIPETELKKIFETHSLIYDRLIHVRLSSIMADLQILQFYYYFKGFPLTRIFTQPIFRGDKADIYYIINEGKKFTVKSLDFEGNAFFSSQVLNSLMQTKMNGPFVQQKLNEDIEKLKNFYYSSGFDKIEVNADVSQGTEKTVLIRIKEGGLYRMGNLIIIGASSVQRSLIRRLFPLEKNDPFDQMKIDVFESEIDNSSIFNIFDVIKINRQQDVVDVMVKANPDYSRYYGFGIGWEERKGFRGTVEYQGRNIFRTYSTFSIMAQLGENEKRGVLSFDTPYFFSNRINSSLKLWADNEIYPSYKFNRFGFSESIIKKITVNSYVMGSFSWYRTELTDLAITPSDIDQTDLPFDTGALNLSFVKENRDDPFNPSAGSYFSVDMKTGLPIFNKEDYTFFKLRWSYQRNFKLFRHSTISASIRNGIGFGDMSITERFFAGGLNSFRGTRRDRLSPIDPVTDNPKGGNILFLLNFEATFPVIILPVRDIFVAVFFDIGNVFEEVRDFNPGKLEKAAGFSLKYKTRMGPLRFDIGWNLKTGKPEIHIGIGNVF